MIPGIEPSPEGIQVKRSGIGTFMLTLVLSLALSFVLSALFHMPIFILGAVLPLFWLGNRR